MKPIAMLSAVALALSLSQVQAQQTKIRSFSEAKEVFWGALYPAGFVEFYCGGNVAAREDHNVEHVFPAFWMTRAIGCGSRRQCRSSSALFNQMEADLHNLYPTRTEVNARRGSHPFAEIDGEDHDFLGCDFEEEAGLVEPRPEVRGNVARAVLYMAEAYDAASGMPAGQLDLMRAWNESDPPDAAERARNARIANLEGVANRFIDAHAGEGNGGEPSPPPTPEGKRVRIATWNIANLHSEIGVHLPGRPSAAARSQQDYDRIARYIAALEADIIAFQEVNGPAAARLVFPEPDYEIVVSDRFDEDAASGQETDHIYTGVAVRKDGAVSFVAGETYRELSVPHVDGGVTRPTRRGVAVMVELPNGEPLQLLSIHLKSACHQGSLENPSSAHCQTLSAQRAPLEAWIDQRSEDDTPFVIAGDWNRRIDIHGANDHIWQEIDDGSPPPLDLFRFPEGVTSPCLSGTSDHRPLPIDFIVLDEQAAHWADAASVQIVDFEAADKPERRQISDHCPVILDLMVPLSPSG